MLKYKVVKIHEGATALANGTTVETMSPSDGAYNNLTIQITGITTATVTFEGTIDGTNWVAVRATNTYDGVSSVQVSADGIYRIAFLTGVPKIRARISAYTAGTIYAVGVLTEN